MPRSARPRAQWFLAGLAALALPPATAQDAANGAMLYMRLASDVRACVSCHGPDPGQNHNNILRAADDPAALTRVLNTVSAMGFLRSRLSDSDIADVSAFLGTVTRLNAPASPLRLWPITMEFGMAPAGRAGVQPDGTSGESFCNDHPARPVHHLVEPGAGHHPRLPCGADPAGGVRHPRHTDSAGRQQRSGRPPGANAGTNPAGWRIGLRHQRAFGPAALAWQSFVHSL
jgi:cytochrome c553